MSRVEQNPTSGVVNTAKSDARRETSRTAQTLAVGAVPQLQLQLASECEQSLLKLIRFCRLNGWAGYDPYDGLNSFFARYLPGKYSRTLLTQLVKISPVNLRPLLGIRSGLNPKALALGLKALVLLANYYQVPLPENNPAYRGGCAPPEGDLSQALTTDLRFLVSRLDALRNRDFGGSAWGYNFDWQSRAFFAPRGTPNAVCTTFAAHAFIDLYLAAGDKWALHIAQDGCEFLLNALNRSDGPSGLCFSYTPLDTSRVHNVNMLVAELLARVFSLTGEQQYGEFAERAASYTLAQQRDDGSWPYGESRSQQWIDGFHTGFLVVSLKHLIEYLGRYDWRPTLLKAYDFYRGRFFLADGTPRYYHDSLYPIDVHNAAQAIITFSEMTDLTPQASETACESARWVIRNMQDPAGFFYFQRRRFYTIKTAHMRWSQAWMLYALSLFISRRPVREDG